MINTDFHLIYKPQWQAQHDPDFAWHCDLMKRESLEEDHGGEKQSLLYGVRNFLIDIPTFWFLNLDHRGSVHAG